MKIFLDTANIEQIRQGARLGVVSGVTTNPTLMYKEGLADYEAAVKEICTIIHGPVSVETLAEQPAAMLEQARKMAKWADYCISAVRFGVVSSRAADGAKATEMGLKSAPGVVHASPALALFQVTSAGVQSFVTRYQSTLRSTLPTWAVI